MFEYLTTIFAKPFLGFALLVRLFVNDHPDTNSPGIASLKLVHLHDSVFVMATIRNGITPEIAELLSGGVVLKTTCTFTCDTFTREWVRELQFNPVSRTGCQLLPDGGCANSFNEDSLADNFNEISFYLTSNHSVTKMKERSAHLTLSTSIMVDAMSIGKKELWPGGVKAEFVVPGVAGK